MLTPLLDLAPRARARLAQALASGTLTVPCSATALRACLGSSANAPGITAALEDLAGRGLTGPAAAAWLQTITEVHRPQRPPDLVWTGPEVPGLHARDTRRVFDELLSTAKQSIWASTYTYYDGQRAFRVLAERMDAVPDLQVTLLLNIQRGRDTSDDKLVVSRFAHRFWSKDWPGARRPRVFYDPRALEQEGTSSVLHAKAIVADDEAVLVTSANFTEAALDRNIELGLLVRERALALSVTSYFRRLIELDTLVALPSSPA